MLASRVGRHRLELVVAVCAIAALVAVAAVGPLAFVDPEETSLILGLEDVGLWAFIAGMLSLVFGLLVAGVYGLALRWSPPRWVPATVAAVVGLAAFGVYVGGGHPGLYGDRLFVVMSEQADLTGLDAIADRTERLSATYTRLVQQADRTQADIRSTLDSVGVHYEPYYLVNGLLVDGGPEVRAWLSGRSDVDRVLIDQRLRPLPAAAATARGDAPAPKDGAVQWNVSLIQADQVWAGGVRGAGIVVGSSDSGVDGAHPDLKDGFRGGADSWYGAGASTMDSQSGPVLPAATTTKMPAALRAAAAGRRASASQPSMVGQPQELVRMWGAAAGWPSRSALPAGPNGASMNCRQSR